MDGNPNDKNKNPIEHLITTPEGKKLAEAIASLDETQKARLMNIAKNIDASSMFNAINKQNISVSQDKLLEKLKELLKE